jgi:hypothetical protein
MKTKLLLFSALALVILCFNGCTPEEVETTQDQFKPLIIRVTSSKPVLDCSPNLAMEADLLILDYQGMQLSINGSYPNQVGDSIVEYIGTAVSNTPLYFTVTRLDYDNHYDSVTNTFQLSSNSNSCAAVTVEIEFNGTVVFLGQKDLGSWPTNTTLPHMGLICGDGNTWNVSFTLP